MARMEVAVRAELAVQQPALSEVQGRRIPVAHRMSVVDFCMDVGECIKKWG